MKVSEIFRNNFRLFDHFFFYIWFWVNMDGRHNGSLNFWFYIFNFSSLTEYVKRESIVIAWVKKKCSPFDESSFFVRLRIQNKRKKLQTPFEAKAIMQTHVKFAALGRRWSRLSIISRSPSTSCGELDARLHSPTFTSLCVMYY